MVVMKWEGSIWKQFCITPPEASHPKVISPTALYSCASLTLASQALAQEVIPFLSPAGQTKPSLGLMLTF